MKYLLEDGEFNISEQPKSVSDCLEIQTSLSNFVARNNKQY